MSILYLKERIKAWVDSQPNIRAILAVGSTARRDHPGDEWADLDLMIFVTDFNAYLAHPPDWLTDIGSVWVSLPHQTGDGDPEWLVLFDGGHKVDFIFYPLAQLSEMVAAQSMPDVYQRGYDILVDKDGLAAQLPPAHYGPVGGSPPSPQVFELAIHHFWYGVLYVAKQIRRRNLWVVKFRDWTVKESSLLPMLEWHARAHYGWDYDTWHDGHFLLDWAVPSTRLELNHLFGRFEAGDSWAALLAGIALFRRLAVETASSLGYAYPTALDENVSHLVDQLYQGDENVQV